MTFSDISALGWAHTIACILGLPLGFVLLSTVKGTGRHRFLGHCYFYAVLVASATALGLPSRLPGARTHFGIFHWLALTVIAALLIGYTAASQQGSRKWAAYAHPTAMIYSYYMLLGALVNELFVRIDALKHLALMDGPHVPLMQSRYLRLSQSALLLIFIGVFVYFLIRAGRVRASDPVRASRA